MGADLQPAIETWYDFLMQQMAAESYFDGVSFSDRDAVRLRLLNGNNRPEFIDDQPRGLTRFTRQQADEFLTRFQILNQWSDNPHRTRNLLPGEPGYLELNGEQVLANTGLSATLIKNIDPTSPYFGTYTLAVRSTEYQSADHGGDYERDVDGADRVSIAANGLALAQLDALDRYYEWLKVTPGMLPPGADLYMTGYSLSGHLVSVFTELHPEVLHAYTFNGAGRGD